MRIAVVGMVSAAAVVILMLATADAAPQKYTYKQDYGAPPPQKYGYKQNYGGKYKQDYEAPPPPATYNPKQKYVLGSGVLGTI